MNGAKPSYSQSGEDLIVDFLFKNMLHQDQLSYLDIGSSDPLALNNTYLFYTQGFRGVCVDANPYFEPLYKQQRPEDIFVCAGIGSKEGLTDFYEIEPRTLSTFSEEEANRYTAGGNHKLLGPIKVPMLRLESILSKYFKEKLPNFLSVDVEGLDDQVLRAAFQAKWFPAVVCVETLTYTQDASETKIQETADLMKSNDYIMYGDTYINSIFVHKAAWDNRS